MPAALTATRTPARLLAVILGPSGEATLQSVPCSGLTDVLRSLLVFGVHVPEGRPHHHVRSTGEHGLRGQEAPASHGPGAPALPCHVLATAASGSHSPRARRTVPA